MLAEFRTGSDVSLDSYVLVGNGKCPMLRDNRAAKRLNSRFPVHLSQLCLQPPVLWRARSVTPKRIVS